MTSPPRSQAPGALSLDHRANLRLFAAGSLPSLAAARRSARSLHRAAGGAWNLLLDALPRDSGDAAALAAGCGLEVRGGRRPLWISGPWEGLRALAARLRRDDSPLAPELEAALDGFERALVSPPPTLVMGILNVTPDSFSDGGLWLDPGAAVERALRMVEEGAGVIDIGGESTRPGAEEVPAEEELRRVLPVVERLRPQTRAALSVDTRKAAVAERCLDAGADWINDVSGLTHDPRLAKVVAARPGTRLVLMHSRLPPSSERYSTEYAAAGQPVYRDVVAETMRWLRQRLRLAVDRGIAPECLWIDPGFGFGKTFEQNREILRRLREYTSIGAPVLIGTSRKSSVGRLVGDLPPDRRLEGTAATVVWAIAQGAACVRVHDVREMTLIARAADALR